MTNHLERGAAELGIAWALSEMANTPSMPLPAALGMLAAAGVAGGIGAVEVVMGLGQRLEPDHETYDPEA